MRNIKIKIRRFKIEDLGAIEYLQPEGWGDIKYYFKFYHESPFCYPIVACSADEIIGVANGISNKTTGWLSHIIVSSEYQRQGIGYRLTEEIMNILTKLGCTSQLLIATNMGEGLYAKLGFRTTTHYNFYIGHQLNTSDDYRNLSKYENKDFKELISLDLEISGEHREHMISQFLAGGWLYRSSGSGELKGYFLPKLGDGVILAKDEKAGTELLKLKHGFKKCKTVLPENNKSGQKFLIDNGFELHNQAKRMVLGDEVKWNPHCVYCRIGGFYG